MMTVEHLATCFIYTEPQKKRYKIVYCDCFIKCDYMAYLHLVKVVRDVPEDKCQILTRCSEAKLL